MKKITPLSDIYKELGIAFTFPIKITNENGAETYYEDNDGYWNRYEYNEKGNETYYETSNGIKRGTKRGSCDGKVIEIDGKVIEIDGKKYKLTEL